MEGALRTPFITGRPSKRPAGVDNKIVH